MTIWDLITSQEIASYWETLNRERAPYLGETLFPAQQKLGLDLKWLKGGSGLPVVLKPSSFDAKAIPRPRIGVSQLTAEMPFFKENMLVNEQTRQELNIALQTGNAALIDPLLTHIFNDAKTLLEGAAARREQMRMMALTTGVIDIEANGQKYTYDYQLPNDNKVDAATAWSNASANIMGELRVWRNNITDATGVTPERAICSQKTWDYFLANTAIRNAIWGNSAAAPVGDEEVRRYINDKLGLDVVVYAKKYNNDAGSPTAFVPDDVFVMFPSGDLGTSWFGTTPEQSDLMTEPNIANVAIVDAGVAVTTTKQTDPVNVDTKVSMIFLPDLPTANQILIADVSGT